MARKKQQNSSDKKPALNQPVSKDFYRNVREILEQARQSAYRAVNFAMVMAYWEVGRLIVEEEQQGKDRAEYGKALIMELSKRLTKDFGKGFSEQSLWNFRQFYLIFPKLSAQRRELEMNSKSMPAQFVFQEKLSAVRRELTWTHYKMLMRVKKEEARIWYMNEAADSGWSTRQLERQINSFYYERLLASHDKAPVRGEAEEKLADMPSESFIKDPYVLEFLDIMEHTAYRENELERALLDKLQDFLLELGRGFAFVARQYRITVDGDHFYCDLVFYNYILKCFLVIDLKIGKLIHEDIGQMDFYVRYFEKEVRQPNDHPTIGLILCSDKSDAMVKYTLLDDSKQLFASKYQLYLPTEEELRKELDQERHLIEQTRE